MKLINAADREYLENKYHRTDAPFDAFQRMNYHGYEYEPETGLSDEEIQAGLAALSDALDGQPHPIVKARMFEYVLDHTRIDVNAHDYFIGMYTWSRPISSFTVNRWNREVTDAFPEASRRLRDTDLAGADFGWLDFDHTAPDWDSIMELGFPGLLARATGCYEALKAVGKLTDKQEAFYRGIEIEYKALIRWIDRLYRLALTRTFDKAPRIAACLKHLRDGAPQNTYEAMQMIFIYFMVSESIEHYQVRTLGHGLDNTLYPFYRRDLESGEWSREDIAELLSYFLMQWSAIGNYWGQPFYLGGAFPDGATRVNEMSHLILDVYHELGIYNPKIQIKYTPSMPKEFVCKALDIVRDGTGIVFCNGDTIIKSLMSLGATYEEGVDGVITGCYEYNIMAGSVNIGSWYFNLLKPVSLVFDNGFDQISGKQIGPKTGDVTEFASFKDFYNAYLIQLRELIERDIDAMDQLQSRVNEVNPSLMYSCTINRCVENMTDALDGGVDNNTTILVSALGSATDALMAVRELVFEKGVTTLAELKRALDSDWVGFEHLRAQALKCAHKYGNGDSMSDHYAGAIHRFITTEMLAGRRNCHGGRYVVDTHSARAFIVHGSKTMATPDGRKRGDETSKNASPAPGADRNGVTALLQSAGKLDTVMSNCGFCLDVMLHPSATQGKEGMDALYSVLKTYMSQGGASIQFNITNAEVLRDAQAHPEKYRSLQVRVCGWNTLWNNMCKEEQDAYILRAENIQ